MTPDALPRRLIFKLYILRGLCYTYGMKKIDFVRAAAVVAAAGLLLGGCSADIKKTGSIEAGAHTIEYIAETTGRQRKKAEDEVLRIEQYLAGSGLNSEIARINAHSGSPVEPSAEIMALIKTALDVSMLSYGAYDLTAYPYERLWGLFDSPRIPDEIELLEAGATVDYSAVVLTKNSIETEPKMEIGLAGLIDGYIASRITSLWSAAGVKGGLITVGGCTAAFGTDENKAAFAIDVADAAGNTAGRLALADTSASTARLSDSNVIDGVSYCRIIDPGTGRPADGQVESVTVICSDAARGCALARAILVGGDAARLCAMAGDFSYVIIYRDGSLAVSADAPFTPQVGYAGSIITEK